MSRTMPRVTRRLVIATVVVAMLVMPLATAALAARMQFRGFAPNRTTVITEELGDATSSQSFVQVPGAYANASVPGKSHILVTFSAESFCNSEGGGWCSVQILVDGVEAHPGDASQFAFDDGDVAAWGGHAMQRVYGPVSAGNHVIHVKYRVSGPSMSFNLNYWCLTIQSFSTP